MSTNYTVYTVYSTYMLHYIILLRYIYIVGLHSLQSTSYRTITCHIIYFSIYILYTMHIYLVGLHSLQSASYRTITCRTPCTEKFNINQIVLHIWAKTRRSTKETVACQNGSAKQFWKNNRQCWKRILFNISSLQCIYDTFYEYNQSTYNKLSNLTMAVYYYRLVVQNFWSRDHVANHQSVCSTSRI